MKAKGLSERDIRKHYSDLKVGQKVKIDTNLRETTKNTKFGKIHSISKRSIHILTKGGYIESFQKKDLYYGVSSRMKLL